MADSASKQLKQMLQALEYTGADLTKLLTGDILGGAQAGLQGVQAKSLPEQAALNLQLYGQFGPEFNRIGNQIAAQNQAAQAANDLATLRGPGGQLVSGLAGLESQINPELAAAKQGGAKSIRDLLGSFDLGPGLSGSERAEGERSLARDRAAGGNEYGSNLNALESAMRFGSAGEQRMQQKQAGLGNALNSVSNLLGTARSGVDMSAALGRPSGLNTGEARYNTGNTEFGQNFMSDLFGTARGSQQLKSQLKSTESINQRDLLDRINETMSSLPIVGKGGSVD